MARFSLTAMYKREAGYDPEDGDWFWAKYNPDDTVQKNPAGVALAGRVAKGAPHGCIACQRPRAATWSSPTTASQRVNATRFGFSFTPWPTI